MINNIQDLNKAIKSIQTRSTKLTESIQDAKNGCLFFFQKDSNCTPAADLLNAVGKGVRYGALKSLFEQAGMKISVDKKSKVFKVKLGKKASDQRIEELTAANWVDFKHVDETPEEQKAESAFKNAAKWLHKYPELAEKYGLVVTEQEEAA